MTMGDRIVILDDGRRQQVGDPSTVYDNPANRFVGGFVGSPSMNFVEVTASRDGDDVVLTGRDAADGFGYRLTDDRAAAIRGGADAYTLGIRPESVEIGDDGPDTVPATVEVVEPVGSDNYLYLDLGETASTLEAEDHPDFVARVDATLQPEIGEVVAVAFPESAVHLFDADTGEAVRTETEPTAVTQ